MIHYDNLEDVKGKLLGTYVYYDDKPCYVKDVGKNTENGQFMIAIMNLGARQKKFVDLDDKKLNFMRFNIGYSNHGHSAVWWYRIPHRQYRQGLKAEQMGLSYSSEAYAHRADFGFGKPVCDMMENVYPNFEETEKALKDGVAAIGAFHKDFAITWDKVHKDMILEYKGKVIGCMKSLTNFDLMEEYAYLTEAFKEAVA